MNPLRTETLPPVAALLGIAGLMPFLALSVQVATGHPFSASFTPLALRALLCYGAVVLSFVGGAQWGVAVASADSSDALRRYTFAVIPPLVAWGALWVEGRNGLMALLVALTIFALYEIWSAGLGEMPRWYGRLRLVLTIGAAAALGAALHFGQF